MIQPNLDLPLVGKLDVSHHSEHRIVISIGMRRSRVPQDLSWVLSLCSCYWCREQFPEGKYFYAPKKIQNDKKSPITIGSCGNKEFPNICKCSEFVDSECNNLPLSKKSRNCIPKM